MMSLCLDPRVNGDDKREVMLSGGTNSFSMLFPSENFEGDSVNDNEPNRH